MSDKIWFEPDTCTAVARDKDGNESVIAEFQDDPVGKHFVECWNANASLAEKVKELEANLERSKNWVELQAAAERERVLIERVKEFDRAEVRYLDVTHRLETALAAALAREAEMRGALKSREKELERLSKIINENDEVASAAEKRLDALEAAARGVIDGPAIGRDGLALRGTLRDALAKLGGA